MDRKRRNMEQLPPDLAGASDALLANVGTDAFPVGELTWDNTSHQWGIDVTDFVRQHADASSNLSFVLIREKRFDGDADTSVITIDTKENSTGKPQLQLFNTANGLYAWNQNAGGKLVDGGELGCERGAERRGIDRAAERLHHQPACGDAEYRGDGGRIAIRWEQCLDADRHADADDQRCRREFGHQRIQGNAYAGCACDAGDGGDD